MTNENQGHWEKFDPIHLENTLALNFCFNVESNRLLTSDVLLEISKLLHSQNKSSTFYGVGNFGFRITDHFGPLGSDGNYEGQWNDPSNDHDIVTITDANFALFKASVNSAIHIVSEKYGDSQSKHYFHWAKLTDPKWNRSNFKIPQYCSLKYQRNQGKQQTEMEVHWLQNKKGWDKILLSNYAPWYSTKIGFPIVNMSVVNEKPYCGIWQAKNSDVNRRKKHEVRISVPENFGSNTRDVLQSVRIIFGIIQASIGAKQFAILSEKTKDILKKGVQQSSQSLNDIQRENSISRLKTTLHRAKCLERELTHDCYVKDYKNPFEGKGTTQEIIINLLDEIEWGKHVLGKTVKEYLS